jgi:DNA-binding transcriptional MerR regulator
MPARITIGDFSRMTHLSVKALRHYHEIGLLVPAAVDHSSGYRLYAVEQVRTAQVIRRLRDLGMPLPDIRTVVMAPDVPARNRAIFDSLRRMEDRLREAQASVESLRRLLAAPDDARDRVVFKSLADTAAIAIAEHVTSAAFDEWWGEAFDDLHAAASRSRLDRTGPDGALYPGRFFEVESADVVAFTPVARPERLTEGGRVQPFVVPASELAVLIHEGPFADIDATYGALGAFVAERAIGVDGPMREYYLVTALDTADETRHRIEVGWPVFRTAPV